MLRLATLALLFALFAIGPGRGAGERAGDQQRATPCRWCPIPMPSRRAPPFRVGLHFRLAPGWHTYWRNPGDAGVAPDLSLVLPPGASAGPIAWPTPRRVAEGPVMTYAYTGDVLLPVTVTPGARIAGRCRSRRMPAGWSARRSACRRRPISGWTCR